MSPALQAPSTSSSVVGASSTPQATSPNTLYHRQLSRHFLANLRAKFIVGVCALDAKVCLTILPELIAGTIEALSQRIKSLNFYKRL